MRTREVQIDSLRIGDIVFYGGCSYIVESMSQVEFNKPFQTRIWDIGLEGGARMTSQYGNSYIKVSR